MTTKRQPNPHAQRPGDSVVAREQRRDAARVKLERALAACKRAGLVCVVDADSIGIRLIPTEEYEGLVDLRGAGELVRTPNGCGGRTDRASGLACSYGNL